jgi:hypothetical protein
MEIVATYQMPLITVEGDIVYFKRIEYGLNIVF